MPSIFTNLSLALWYSTISNHQESPSSSMATTSSPSRAEPFQHQVSPSEDVVDGDNLEILSSKEMRIVSSKVMEDFQSGLELDNRSLLSLPVRILENVSSILSPFQSSLSSSFQSSLSSSFQSSLSSSFQFQQTSIDFIQSESLLLDTADDLPVVSGRLSVNKTISTSSLTASSSVSPSSMKMTVNCLYLNLTECLLQANQTMIQLNRSGINEDYDISESGSNNNGTMDKVDLTTKTDKVYWAIVLILLPCLAVFGNMLVILSVFRERSLHNVTNYFIVNLAFADLLVAGVVMPFAVYYLVNIDWELSQSLCDFWIAVDVLCSTASILNLVAISVDRFIAVTNPIKYAKHKSGKRVSFTIGFVWLVSATIASPIVFGLNNTPDRQPTLCIFYNSDFIIYSSLGSFYIPCLLMIYLYYRIFKAIHERTKRNAELNGKRQQLQRRPVTEPAKALQSSSSQSPGSNHGALVIENTSNAASLQGSEQEAIKKISFVSIRRFKNKQKSNGKLRKEKQQAQLSAITEAEFSVTSIGGMDSREYDEEEDEEDEEDYDSNECKVIKNKQVVCETPIGNEEIESKGVNKETTKHDYGSVIVNIDEVSDEDGFKMKMETLITNPRVESTEMERLQTTTKAAARAKGTSRTQSSNLSDSMCNKNETQATEPKKKKSRFNLGRKAKKGKLKREKASAKRERKATKTLAIVLGVFLFCWVPFFTCNIMDAICIKLESEDCKLGMTAFLLTTWLGYINSCANPVIYTIFNPEFRKAFKKILTQPCGKR